MEGHSEERPAAAVPVRTGEAADPTGDEEEDPTADGQQLDPPALHHQHPQGAHQLAYAQVLYHTHTDINRH